MQDAYRAMVNVANRLVAPSKGVTEACVRQEGTRLGRPARGRLLRGPPLPPTTYQLAVSASRDVRVVILNRPHVERMCAHRPNRLDRR